jgi:hypothetical protein
MSGVTRRIRPAAVARFALVALLVGVGVAPATAQKSKGPDLTELRSAVRAAEKRGDNVAEIAKALTALEQVLARGAVAAGPGRPAPPELVALREAVEAAGRKGENVETIRKELEAVEKAMTGQALVKPKPVPAPEPGPAPVRPNPRGPDPFLPEFPNFPNLGGGGLDPNELKKAQDLLQKALGGGLNNPNDLKMLPGMLPPGFGGGLNPNDQKMLEALLKQGLAGLNNPKGDGLKDLLATLEAMRGIEQFGADLGLPEFAPRAGGLPQFPGVNRPRLGIRLERLTPIVVEQLGLEKGQGVSVAAVDDGSPAAKAGLKAHDIVLEFAGKPISDDPGDLVRRVNEVKAGTKVDLVVLRKGKRVEIKGIELTDPPANPQPLPRMPK